MNIIFRRKSAQLFGERKDECRLYPKLLKQLQALVYKGQKRRRLAQGKRPGVFLECHNGGHDAQLVGFFHGFSYDNLMSGMNAVKESQG